jgi:phage/plasmid primase-like uncharacterized protein
MIALAAPVPSCRTAYETCPCCGQKNALAVTLREGKKLYHCFYGCDQDSLWRVMRGARPPAHYPTPKPRQRVNLESVEAYAWKLLNGSFPAQGKPPETYLRGRSVTIPIPATIRHLPNCRHTPSGKNYPAMIAVVADYTGKVFAVHRTYLLPDGTGKADVTPAKMSLGNIGGHGVFLAPLAEKMCVTEGIETALAVQQATGIPAIAALSAGNMTRLVLPPLPLAAEVIVCGDNDVNGCGQRAAHDAARRWIAEGRKVRIAMPPTPDTDFNDMIMEFSK